MLFLIIKMNLEFFREKKIRYFAEMDFLIITPSDPKTRKANFDQIAFPKLHSGAQSALSALAR